MADHHHRYHVYYFFLVLFSALACFSHAHQFIVGGKYGWVINPSENYNHWAERLRFQVNDTLLFKYKKGSDSVVVVNNKDDYDNCNTGNPKLKLDDGNSVYKFDRSGPTFFISGNKTNCAAGQKLIVVVLAVRNYPSPPKAPSPAPAPASSPAYPLPPAEGPAPESGDGPSANSTPADGDGAAPPPHRRSFAAPTWNPSVVLVLAVSLVLSVCGGGFVFSV